MPDMTLTLGERLKVQRSRERLRNREVAQRLAMSETKVERLLGDQLTRLDVREVQRIAQLLGTTTEDVVRAHDAGRAAKVRT